MAKFKSTRDQLVDGKHVKTGESVEVDAERVTYLVTRGYLVEVEETAKKSTKKSSKAE